MKKLILFLLALTLGLVLTGCQSAETDSTDRSKSFGEEVKKDDLYKDELYKWFLNEQKDEFGDSTGKYVATNALDGHFSNIATVNSECITVLFVNKNQAFYIKLLEYNHNPANGLSNEVYYLSLKDQNGKKYTYAGKVSNGYFYLTGNDSNPQKPNQEIISSNQSEIIDLFYTDQPIKGLVYRISDGTYCPKYEFEIPGDARFSMVWDELMSLQ